MVGHRWTCNRTSVTCFTVPVLHLSSVAKQLFCPIARLHSLLSYLENEHLRLAQGQKGCSPPSSPCQNVACRFRKISGRSERAAEPKLPRPFNAMVLVCGRACYNTHPPFEITMKKRSRQLTSADFLKERAHRCLLIHTSHYIRPKLHTPAVYILSSEALYELWKNPFLPHHLLGSIYFLHICMVIILYLQHVWEQCFFCPYGVLFDMAPRSCFSGGGMVHHLSGIGWTEGVVGV